MLGLDMKVARVSHASTWTFPLGVLGVSGDHNDDDGLSVRNVTCKLT